MIDVQSWSQVLACAVASCALSGLTVYLLWPHLLRLESHLRGTDEAQN